MRRSLVVIFSVLVAQAHGLFYSRFENKKIAAVTGTLADHTISSVSGVKFAESCLQSCTANADCKAVHFEKSAEKCHLMKEGFGDEVKLKTEVASGDVTYEYRRTQPDGKSGDPNVVSTRTGGSTYWKGLEKTISTCAKIRRMGMAQDTMEIPDESITSSGYHYEPAIGARLNHKYGWFHLSPSWTGTWLQVKLNHISWIHRVLLQGSTHRAHWMTSFRVYYTIDEYIWAWDTNSVGTQIVYDGSTTAAATVTVNLRKPLMLRVFRIYPRTFNTHVGVRFELEGCAAQCMEPLGIQGGEIKDEDMEGDSYHHLTLTYTSRYLFGGYQGRWNNLFASFRTNNYDLGNEDVYLDVKLGEVKYARAFAIQGCGYISSAYFTPEIKLKYCARDCRPEGPHKYYKRKDGKVAIPGCAHYLYTNIYELDPPLIASRVRFVAHRRNSWTCFRVELLGCNYHFPEPTPNLSADKTVVTSSLQPLDTAASLTDKNSEATMDQSTCATVKGVKDKRSYVSVDLGAKKNVRRVKLQGPNPAETASLKPIGLWLFNFFQGGMDMSTNYNHATIMRGVTYTTDPWGNAKGAIQFTDADAGSHSHVKIANTNNLYETPKFSFFVWAKRTQTWNIMNIFTFETYLNDMGMTFVFWMNSYLHTNFFTDHSASHFNSPANSVPMGWNFIGIAYDGIFLKMYVNGKQVQSQFMVGTRRNSGDIYLGNWIADSRKFTGALTCFQIYDRVLTDPEIQQAMACPWRPRFPVSMWPLDEVSAATDIFGSNPGTPDGLTVSMGPHDLHKRAYKFALGKTLTISNANGALDAKGQSWTLVFHVLQNTVSYPSKTVFRYWHSNAAQFRINLSRQYVLFEHTCMTKTQHLWLIFKNMPYGDFKHVAMSYNHVQQRIELFLNGEIQTARNFDADALCDTSGDMIFGSDTFDGSLACISYFDRALTERQIQLTGKCPVNPWYPVYYAPFDRISDGMNMGSLTPYATRPWLQNGLNYQYAAYWSQLYPMRTRSYAEPLYQHAYALNPNGYTRVQSTATMKLDSAEGWTFAIWVRPNAANPASQKGCVMMTFNAGANLDGAFLWQNSDNTWRVAERCSNGYTPQLFGGTVQVNVWQHVAGVYDKTTNTQLLYVNGKMVKHQTGLSACTTGAATAIGVGMGYASYGWHGQMQCASAYNTPLTQEHIQRLAYSCPHGNPAYVEGTFYTGEASEVWHGAGSNSNYDDGTNTWRHLNIRRSPTDPVYPVARCWRAAVTTGVWFQVYVFTNAVYTSVMTQGRPDADEWITEYQVQTLGGSPVHYWYNSRLLDPITNAVRRFGANWDRNTVVKNLFNPPLKRMFYIRMHVTNYYGHPAGRYTLEYFREYLDRSAVDFQPDHFLAKEPVTAGYNENFRAFHDDIGTARWSCCNDGAGDHIPWIQINLWEHYMVSAVGTFGGYPHNNEYITKFSLQKGFDGINFQVVKDDSGMKKLFVGNTEYRNEKVNVVGVVTRYLRFVVETYNVKPTAKFMVYGTPYNKKYLPKVEVWLSDIAVTDEATAASGTLCTSTDREHDYLGAEVNLFCPETAAGRYLTIITTDKQQDMRICDLKTYEDNSLNYAAHRPVVLSDGLIQYSADTKQRLTDGLRGAEGTHGTGMSCMHGEKLFTAAGVSAGIRTLFDFRKVSCSGKVVYLERLAGIHSDTTGYGGVFSYGTFDYSEGTENITEHRNITILSYMGVDDKSYLSEEKTFTGWLGTIFKKEHSLDVSVGDSLFSQNTFRCPVTYKSNSYNYPFSTWQEIPRYFGYSQKSTTILNSHLASTGGYTPTFEVIAWPIYGYYFPWRWHIVDPAKSYWLAVNLEESRWVSRVIVYTWTDIDQRTMAGSEVLVGVTAGAGQTCNSRHRFYAIPAGNEPVEYPCFEALRGTFVTLRRSTWGILPVTEMMVF